MSLAAALQPVAVALPLPEMHWSLASSDRTQFLPPFSFELKGYADLAVIDADPNQPNLGFLIVAEMEISVPGRSAVRRELDCRFNEIEEFESHIRSSFLLDRRFGGDMPEDDQDYLENVDALVSAVVQAARAARDDGRLDAIEALGRRLRDQIAA